MSNPKTLALGHIHAEIGELSSIHDEAELRRHIYAIHRQILLLVVSTLISMEEASELEDHLGKARKAASLRTTG